MDYFDAFVEKAGRCFFEGNMEAVSEVLLTPTVIYEGRDVRVIPNSRAFEAYLKKNKAMISFEKGRSITHQIEQILQPDSVTAVLSVIWSIRDVDKTPICRSSEKYYCKYRDGDWSIVLMEIQRCASVQ